MRPAALLAACALLASACGAPSPAERTGESPPATTHYVTTTRAPTTTTTTTATTTTRAPTTTTTTTLPKGCAGDGSAEGTDGFVALEVSVDTYGGTERWFIQRGHYSVRVAGEEEPVPVPVAAAWTCPGGEAHLNICLVPPEGRARLMGGQPDEIKRAAQEAVGAEPDGIWGPRSNRALDGFCAERGVEPEPTTTTTTTTTTTRPRPTTTLRRVVSSGTISGWHIKLLHVNSNANSAMRNANMFNPDPPAGGKFALMSVEVRYLG